MNEEQKQKYHKDYKKAKEKDGKRFWPDIIYKDLIVSFALLLLLIGFAAFVGVEWEPRADPSDSSYVPRPEWYFLFLFEFLKFIPGKIEWVGTTLIPGLAVGALLALPFIDRSPKRHWKNRIFGVTIMTLVVIGIVGLTISAIVSTPEQEESAATNTISGQIIAGQDLYSVYCTECHGPEGIGGEVELEDGSVLNIKSISGEDEMWTRTDDTLFNIVNAGQTSLGMPPTGLAYGGELKTGEIAAVVTFMRYTWDERAELPADAAFSIPELAEGEVPSYEVHIQPLTKKYCISCHREGKENNDYLMGSYEEMIKTGHNAPNIIAADMESILLQTIHGNEVEGKPVDGQEAVIDKMPPKSDLSEEFIALFELWIENGMPETAEDAAALSTNTAP